MPNRSRIDVEGIPELQKALKEAAAETMQAAAEAVAEEVKAIGDDARRTVPVETGELRRSIRDAADGTSGTVKATARHAGFVEHGTKNTPASPYMHPAAERSRPRLPKRAATIIRAALERRGR